MNARIRARFTHLLLAGLFIFSGHFAADAGEKQPAKTKGATNNVQTHYIGRFSIGMPAEMKQAARTHKLRDTEIKEVVWPKNKKSEDARKEAWDGFMTEIAKLKPPKGRDRVIITKRDFPAVDQWASGIFFHDKNDYKNEATWTLLVDAKQNGIWLKGRAVIIEDETVSNNMSKNLTNIAKFYRVLESNTPRPKGDWFYLQHGAINLPYKWQEESYVRFEGHPLKLKLEVEMHETYKVQKAGLIEKTMAAITTGYASGVELEKIRSRKRAVAGLDGEEEVIRGTENKESKLNFAWEYVGKENSGEHPRTLITMDSPDGNLDEKLKIWDAILDSMQPMYK